MYLINSSTTHMSPTIFFFFIIMIMTVVVLSSSSSLFLFAAPTVTEETVFASNNLSVTSISTSSINFPLVLTGSLSALINRSYSLQPWTGDYTQEGIPVLTSNVSDCSARDGIGL